MPLLQRRWRNDDSVNKPSNDQVSIDLNRRENCGADGREKQDAEQDCQSAFYRRRLRPEFIALPIISGR